MNNYVEGLKKIKAQNQNGREKALSPVYCALQRNALAAHRRTWVQVLVVSSNGQRKLCPFNTAPGLRRECAIL